MRAVLRFLLSLLVCAALVAQADAALPVPGGCSTNSAMVMGAMNMTGNCPSSKAAHASMGKLCKATAACSPTVPVFQAASRLPDSPYQRFQYPPSAAHFVLQDFPQALLRPPRLA
ncbi:hypothetical protein KEX41_29140 (plasmid) [Burkholderia thailandensis]|uniref:hypothetical protein n=1 Tax=Burkholderia thailandensis TaxID=57975 RepID=UPI00192D7B9F|nr:hypothetical protein [Burkholderia thailandensis]MBS2132252.1 hypothetical protein [Burkholderia thailandensis]QRA15344.1 hypothetical protein JMY07_29565 [Burkholderia thailandensis]